VQLFCLAACQECLTTASCITLLSPWQGYWRLVRGWNALPSMALVLLGAWTGAGKTLLALKHLTGMPIPPFGWVYSASLPLLPVILSSASAACACDSVVRWLQLPALLLSSPAPSACSLVHGPGLGRRGNGQLYNQ
jgi:hypothetical protein